MWLLEQEGDVFGGRRLWLRPGKLYLFGRTATEQEPAGQLAISHKTISRKHMTIHIDHVKKGDSQNISTRSAVTIEDLSTKLGTTVDGHKFKGDKYVITGESARLKIGNCPDVFRLSWHPVVLTFSFTNRELQADPFSRLRDRLEQLDVKLAIDYNAQHTTHVVSKKRNTSKGLQALINGKHIVTDSYIDAIEAIATPSADSGSTDSSPLESDFDANWPNPLEHLPPRGGEPVERSVDAYAPDPARHDIFEGYTFIFYDQSQFNNLLAPITNGKGKALYTEVVPGQTSVDDFVLFVKTEAGEKGLGCFDDGSEGRGVVVVRFTPGKGEHIDWYANFFTEVSLRLDHRPIEQNEFLEAILIKDASILRRPLEMASTQETPSSSVAQAPNTGGSAMDVDRSAAGPGQGPAHEPASQDTSTPPEPPARRSRTRRAPTRRFAGFDDGDDTIIETAEPAPPPPPLPQSAEPESQEGLFVSQEPEPLRQGESEDPATAKSTRSQRKRGGHQLDESDLMDGLIPHATAAKRRRIEAGEDPIERRSVSASPEEASKKQQQKPTKKVKKELDVLEEARKRREQLEAQAKAEKEDLDNLPDDVDLDAIRRLHIVEEMPLRRPHANGADGDKEQEIADGRWDPRWNGRKNFKRFRQRGATTGRAPMKVIVQLSEVKKKDFGIGDDYWLEDGDSHEKDRGADETRVGTVDEDRNQSSSARSGSRSQGRSAPPEKSKRPPAHVVLSDDEDDQGAVVVEALEPEPSGDAVKLVDDDVDDVPAPSRRTRGARSTATQQSQARSSGTSGAANNSSRSQAARPTSQSKRPAPAPTREPPAKKPRPTRRVAEVADSDDSDDDDLQFKFGRRR